MLGLGTAASPFIIESAQDFNLIRNNLTAYYELANDLDMSSITNFQPIGSTASIAFAGRFDGKGHKVSNIKIRSTVNYVAPFGFMTGGYIRNLGFENVDIETTGLIMGGFIGRANSGSITNCYVTGTVKSTNANGISTGGFIGENYGALIENSYAICNVTGQRRVSGFVASASGTSTSFVNCYSASAISGSNANEIGGFVAFANANAGNVPSFARNYFDSEVAGTTRDVRAGVIPRNTAGMKSQTNYIDWDFVNTWQIKDGEYPTLKVFNPPDTSKHETAEVTSFVESFVSKSDCVRRKVVIPLSFVQEIHSTVSKELTTSCMSYMDELYSEVEVKINGREKEYTVTSFINEIAFSTATIAKASKAVESYIDSIESYVEIILPFRPEVPVYATVHFITNPSQVDSLTNQINIHKTENKSETSVI